MKTIIGESPHNFLGKLLCKLTGLGNLNLETLSSYIMMIFFIMVYVIFLDEKNNLSPWGKRNKCIKELSIGYFGRPILVSLKLYLKISAWLCDK